MTVSLTEELLAAGREVAAGALEQGEFGFMESTVGRAPAG